MKKLFLVGALTALFFFAVNNTASAILTVMDWHAPGDGLITLDTDTGLEWLDITATQGIAASEMLMTLETSQGFEGFRYATHSDFEALNDALNVTWGTSWNSHTAGVITMQGLFGGMSTYSSYNYKVFSVEGYAVDALTNYVSKYGYTWRFLYGNPPSYNHPASVDCFRYNEFKDVCDPRHGHFLVKDSAAPVPEPGTVVLLGIGLCGMAVCGKKLKRS